MSDPQDHRTAPSSDDDLSIVPGLVADPVPAPRAEFPGRLDPALDPDRYDPVRADAAYPTGPLDLSQDPDRYDPSRDAAPVGRLDPRLDPDRYDPAGDPAAGSGRSGRTLPELLGEGAFEEKRDGYEWALGLLGIIAFIALVSWFFTSVVSP